MFKLILKAFGITLLLLSGGVGWFVYDYFNFINSPLSLSGDTAEFEAKPGYNLKKITQHLEQQKIISKPNYFIWYAKLSGRSPKIHVGEYLLKKGDTPKELLNMLVAGKVRLYTITIVEGWAFKQVLAELHKHKAIDAKLTGLKAEEIMNKLGYAGQHPEGRFFPETYSFTRGMTDIEFLKRAYKAMDVKLNAAWEKRDKDIQVKSAYEALILASIVEKETGVAAERGKIAGVFSRRIKIGMKLQTDPTVIYGIGDAYDGNIRRKDLRTDTPYNTYTRFGLPPTPIAMPSGAAIDAVLHPEPGNALYFVSRGNGSHYFSATLQEHNQAVVKYQLRGKAKPFSSFDPNKDPDKKDGTDKAENGK